MRTFSDGFAAHIAGGMTTLCWCWRLVRPDGTELAFTDHDRAIAFGGWRFAPTEGLDGGESVARTGAQTQTWEVLGVLGGDAVREEDILAGRYDGARVESWRDPAARALIRVDTIGEIMREDGVFRAELRSGQQAMNLPRGRFYQHVCDARLGDARCGVDLGAPGMEGATCDRSFATCRGTFGNGVNFRGFPHIPGNDALLRYPESGDALDGAPVVR